MTSPVSGDPREKLGKTSHGSGGWGLSATYCSLYWCSALHVLEGGATGTIRSGQTFRIWRHVGVSIAFGHSKDVYTFDHICLGNWAIHKELEGTARYAGLLLAPAEGFGLWPRLFLPFGQKNSLLCCFGPFLAFFGLQ